MPGTVGVRRDFAGKTLIISGAAGGIGAAFAGDCTTAKSGVTFGATLEGAVHAQAGSDTLKEEMHG